MLSYAAVVLLALSPLVFNGSYNGSTQKGLVVMSTAMACFSAYLISILVFKIGSPCPWCILSASLSICLAALIWAKSSEHLKLGVVSAAGTLLASVVVYFACSTNIAIADAQATLDKSPLTSERFSPPPITRASSKQALRVASLLKAKKANFYGAYWCSHCYDQKQLFGSEGMSMLPYIECAADGENSQRNLCQAKKIPGYPTWEIDGELYPGEMSLSELEDIALGKGRPPP
jgi:hypothetical protein